MEKKHNYQKIEQLYAESLVTVFDECIIANLSDDYYVNCQKDMMWTDIPERGEFGAENLRYASITVHPDDFAEFCAYFSREAMLRLFGEGKKQISRRLRRKTADGTWHMVEFTSARIKAPEDECWCVLVFRDINEEYLQEKRQQEAEQERERRSRELMSEALEKAEAASMAKSEFLSKMSHDIRTPMNAILGMTALAKIHLDDKKRLEDYLNKIEISGNHLLGLINEVLDMNKIESGKVELAEADFDLTDMVRDAVLMVQTSMKKKEQRLTVDIQEGINKVVRGDEQRLRQVLINLLDNASKYTGFCGKIRVTLRELESEGTSGTYRLVIEDNGIGMEKEYLERIFEPFSRADDSRISKITGTGLGMTIVWNTVKMMGGDIKVESEYGKGTRFTLTFYLIKSRSRDLRLKAPEVGISDNLDGMKILLVEDNEMNQQIAREMLTLLGTQVELANNGREAVEAIFEKPAYYYDMVFMDVQMPVMNGYEAAERIRESGLEGIDELPIIALTADAFSEDVIKTKKAGMNDHLVKPVSIDSLRTVLGKYAGLKFSRHEELASELPQER